MSQLSLPGFKLHPLIMTNILRILMQFLRTRFFQHHRQSFFELVGLCIALCLTICPVATASTIDPLNLESNWWAAIEEGDTESEAQTSELIAQLRNVPVGASDQEKTTQSLDTIQRYFQDYKRLKSLDALPFEEIASLPETFSLTRLIAYASAHRDNKLAIDIERDELDQRTQSINSTEADLNNLRAQYFSKGQQSTTRFADGVRIILLRFRLAVLTEEHRLIRALLNTKEATAKEMADQLKAASGRLIFSQEDEHSFARQLEAANAEIEALAKQTAALDTNKAAVGGTSLAVAATRLHSQKLIGINARSAIAVINRDTAAVGIGINQFLMSDANRRSDKLTDSLRVIRLSSKSVDDMRLKWRRAADIERQNAESAVSSAEETALGAINIHRQRLGAVDETLAQLSILRDKVALADLVTNFGSRLVAKDQGRIATFMVSVKDSLSGISTSTYGFASKSLFTVNDTPVTTLGLLRVILILSLAWWASKIVRHGLGKLSENSDASNRASLYTVGRLFHYVILTIGILIGLTSVGLDFTKLAIFVSALGVGLGFGLQAIFSNFVAGLIILFERSLKVGDFVELESGVTGEVKEINIRSTLMTTNDNIDILVPNSEFVSGQVTNWTLREAYRRVKVPFGVAYGTDKELVKKAALEAAEAIKFTYTGQQHRLPQVWLVEFGDSSLNFELVVWLIPDAVSRPSAVHAAYTWELETALAKYGIEIPFPQRDLHIRSGFAADTKENSAPINIT